MTECENARKNPVCPYITTIKQSACDINDIKIALIGKDFQGGIVKKVGDIEGKVNNALNRRWGPKDYASAAVALAALITALTAIMQGIPI